MTINKATNDCKQLWVTMQVNKKQYETNKTLFLILDNTFFQYKGFFHDSVQFFSFHPLFYDKITENMYCLCRSNHNNIFRNIVLKVATLRCTNISHSKFLTIGKCLFKISKLRHPRINDVWGDSSCVSLLSTLSRCFSTTFIAACRIWVTYLKE